MMRALQIGLLLMALLGVVGQSSAIAMIPASGVAASAHDMLRVSTADMDCGDMVSPSGPGNLPCKKGTLQCMAAMGGAPVALVEPVSTSARLLTIERVKSTMPLAARLCGRSYGPEPDPPTFLI